MRDIEEEWFARLEKEIYMGGSGKHDWRVEARSLMREISSKVSIDFIELKLGLQSDGDEHMYNRVMVAMYGNQANGPLVTKPGQMTYNDDMTGKSLSRAQTSYPLPPGWNQVSDGDGMIENAHRMADMFFIPYLEAAWNSIPESVFQSCLVS